MQLNHLDFKPIPPTYMISIAPPTFSTVLFPPIGLKNHRRARYSVDYSQNLTSRYKKQLVLVGNPLAPWGGSDLTLAFGDRARCGKSNIVRNRFVSKISTTTSNIFLELTEQFTLYRSTKTNIINQTFFSQTVNSKLATT